MSVFAGRLEYLKKIANVRFYRQLEYLKEIANVRFGRQTRYSKEIASDSFFSGERQEDEDVSGSSFSIGYSLRENCRYVWKKISARLMHILQQMGGFLKESAMFELICKSW
jgi:hypothetical protein